jgi:CdiI immunity protein
MSLTKNYPALTNLFGGHLHVDWKDCYLWDKEPHYADIIRFFKVHNSEETVINAPQELREFLSKEYDGEKLEDALHNHLILGLLPSYWNLTYQEWLEDVLRILEEPMEVTKKQYIPYKA